MRWKIDFALIQNLMEWSFQALRMPPQFCYRGMCKIISQYDYMFYHELGKYVEVKRIEKNNVSE